MYSMRSANVARSRCSLRGVISMEMPLNAARNCFLHWPECGSFLFFSVIFRIHANDDRSHDRPGRRIGKGLLGEAHPEMPSDRGKSLDLGMSRRHAPGVPEKEEERKKKCARPGLFWLRQNACMSARL